jgi:pre-peptidase
MPQRTYFNRATGSTKNTARSQPSLTHNNLSTSQGLEPLEPRLLLSATLPGQETITPVSASDGEIISAAVGNEVVFQEQTQLDNFFKPNVITFDFPIDPDAVHGLIDITALSDLDNPSEFVSFDAEGIVTADLFTATDDGLRPFTATINLADLDLTTLAADGNLHIEFTPSTAVDDFGDVSEYVTLGLTYEVPPSTIALTPVTPLLFGAYKGSVAGEINDAADVDTYTLDLEAGQTIRLESVPDIGLTPTVELLDPADNVIYTGTSAVPGGAIMPQAIAVPLDGTYSVRLSSDGSLGPYNLNVFVNEAIEEESIGGSSNDDLASAQSLDSQFRDLGTGMQRAVVRGSTLKYVAVGHPAASFFVTESFEAGVLPTGWTTSSTGSGRVWFSSAYGAADGSYTMLMDSFDNYSYGNNEAIWTVDLQNDRPMTLSFDRITWSESSNTLPTTYAGSRNGDGVSISDDGTNWYTIQNAWYTSTPTWQNTTIDLAAAAATAGMTLGSGFQIKFQQYDNYSITSEGRGYDNIVLTSLADQSIPSAMPDFYKVTLDADQFASFHAVDPDGDSIGIRLYDPAGTLLYNSAAPATTDGISLTDFKAPSAGEYVIEVFQAHGDYQLSVLLDGTNDSLSNDSFDHAQRLDRTGEVYGITHSGEPDYFSVPVVAGDTLVFETTTPNDGVSGLNTSDPMLHLYDANGILITSDQNGAPDGRNALISHTALTTATYFVAVSSTPTFPVGVYTLKATGFTGTITAPIEVLSSSITEGESLNSKPGYIDLALNEDTMPGSLDPADLTLNGEPATSVTALSGTMTLRFYLPTAEYVQGTNTISLAGGSLRNFQGELNELFTLQFTLDTILPTVIESSIKTTFLELDVLPAGDTTITVKFSEPVFSTQLDTGGHTRLNTTTIESFVDYDELTHELTVTYAGLTEGLYTFTIDDLASGLYIQDVAGNRLDGNPDFITTVPSGDGYAGGDFYVNFGIEDGAVTPLTLTPTPVGPYAAFAYESDFSDTADFAGDEERYALELEAGQVLTISMDSGTGLSATEIELLDPLGAVVASSVGGPPLLNAVSIAQNGTYTLLVRATSFSVPGFPVSDIFTGHVLINAVNEAENVGGPSNDDPATAQDLNPALFPLGDGIEQAVVLGGLPPYTVGFSESFESGSLDSAWTTTALGATNYSRIQVTNAGGAADGSYALLMDTSYSYSGYVLNEAVWTVDLSNYADVTLSFAQAEWNDEEHALAADFTNHYYGDGVAISDDGANWHTVLSAPNTSSGYWQDYTFDLSAAAASAGMTLGADFQIKFQQYDDDPRSSDGRGYDDIQITGTQIQPAPSDMYVLALDAGDNLSVMLDGAGTPSSLELLDAGGGLLAIGSDSWQDATGLISGFIAPTVGDYYIRVDNLGGLYTLIATRDADYSPEPTSSATVLDIGPSGSVVGAIELESDSDTYAFSVNAGDNLTLWTTTPSFDPLTPANTLDIYLELIGPDGLLKAEGGTGGDGLNALLNYTADQTGRYTVKLRSEAIPQGAAIRGGYVLNVTGQTGAAQPLQVASTSISDGAMLTTRPTELTVNFTAPIRLDTLDVADLTVNGIAATSVTLLDADSVTFSLPAGLGDGTYDFTLAAGSLIGLGGQAIEAFSQQNLVDTVAPRVISTSIVEGATLEPGEVLLTIGFDEELATASLNNFDVDVSIGGVFIDNDSDVSFEYDPSTSIATIGFDALSEGTYGVYLNSASSAFRDLAGNLLDGEGPVGPVPPNVSGDGTPGGDFILSFEVDNLAPVDIRTPHRLMPLGSLASLSKNTGLINTPTDTDTFNVFMQMGQTITAYLSSDQNPSYLLYLTGPGGTAVQANAVDPVVLNYTHTGPDGMIDLVVSADVAQAEFDLTVYFNTAFESSLPELIGSGEPVYDLSGAWLNLAGGSVSTATVLGTGQPARSITQTDNVFAPGSLPFNFTDMTIPTGDGTLIITAKADLGEPDEFLSINGEGQFAADVFTPDGGENSFVTTTLVIPQAALEAMAANGTISFTVTPSVGVGNYGDSELTLDLSYPGMPAPPIDDYALDLTAGQAVSAVVESLTGGFAVELIDTATGLSVAVGTADTLFDHALIDFVAPSAGRYDLRVLTPSVADYTLSILRGATPDLVSNDSSVDVLPSLDAAGAALGNLQTPGPERLYAIDRYSSQFPMIVELDPLTLEPIDQITLEENFTAGNLAYDGINLYILDSRGSVIQVIDPDAGSLRHMIIPDVTSPLRGLAAYGGDLVSQAKSGELVFIDPHTGTIKREVELSDNFYSIDALAGAGPRGSIFVADQIEGSQLIYAIYEIDAQTGQTLNAFSTTQYTIRSLAYQDGKIYAYADRTRNLGVYDADTGQLISLVGSVRNQPYSVIGGDGIVPSTPLDRYTLTLAAGEQVTLSTDTPFDNPAGIPLNSLDPALRVLDPNGVEVALDDNGAADGKNALLSLTATEAGVYTVEVSAVSGTGEYLLDVDRENLLAGDINGDGFVGITDLNILLGNWNKSVTAGDLAQGDTNGDGFVGIADLNAVLGNWNAGTPPLATAAAASQPAVESSVASPRSGTQPESQVAVTVTEPQQQTTKTRRRGITRTGRPAPRQTQPQRLEPDNRAAVWNYQKKRSEQRTSTNNSQPWTLMQEEDSAELGLWEQDA